MAFTDGDQVVFRAWFCLKTVENLYEHPRISLGVLDPVTGKGYQLMGRMERVEGGYPQRVCASDGEGLEGFP